MASSRWQLAGTVPRSLLFLSAMVVTALFAGLTAASGSRYLAWMDERARRLETERDQQAVIVAAANGPGSPGNCTTSSRTACRW